MEFGPQSFKFESNGIYIIMETYENISKPIYTCWSYEKAKSYLNPNRKIIGPVPVLDGFISTKNPDFYPPKLPRFDPIFPN